MNLEQLLVEAGVTAEEIMAYADGVLAADRRAPVREALAKYAELMQLFESYVFTRGSLARPFEDVLAACTPDRTLQVVLGANRQPPQSRWRSLIDRLNPAAFAQLRVRMPVFSLAAVSALMLGAAIGWLLHYAVRDDVVTFDRRGVIASAALQRALEVNPSGTSARVARNLSVTPQLTFETQKAWCREFSLRLDADLQVGGLACRGDDGSWRVHVATEPMPADPVPTHPSPGVVYGPVGDGGILDAARDRIKKDVDVPTAAEERDLIKKNWKRTQP